MKVNLFNVATIQNTGFMLSDKYNILLNKDLIFYLINTQYSSPDKLYPANIYLFKDNNSQH